MTTEGHVDLVVDLGQRAYPITIGRGLLNDESLLTLQFSGHSALLLVADANVWERWGAPLGERLKAMAPRVLTHLVTPGEESKSVNELAAIWEVMARGRLGRDGAIIAIGGGVIGDLAGFAAATWMRGVDFYQVPTTLLAMVDSSVGGKTGINLPAGKNLVGSFWQPKAVVADIATLDTLPRGECISALAEVIKYGIIRDAEFFAWLEESITSLLTRDEVSLRHAIRRSCEVKADVVALDERESGLREILNLGHTIGHAIEAVAGYGVLRHGEAISLGMIAEGRLAITAGTGWTSTDQKRMELILHRAGLPTTLPPSFQNSVESLVATTTTDKKNRGGAIRCALPQAIGRCATFSADPAAIAAAIGHILP